MYHLLSHCYPLLLLLLRFQPLLHTPPCVYGHTPEKERILTVRVVSHRPLEFITDSAARGELAAPDSVLSVSLPACARPLLALFFPSAFLARDLSFSSPSGLKLGLSPSCGSLFCLSPSGVAAAALFRTFFLSLSSFSSFFSLPRTVHLNVKKPCDFITSFN